MAVLIVLTLLIALDLAAWRWATTLATAGTGGLEQLDGLDAGIQGRLRAKDVWLGPNLACVLMLLLCSVNVPLGACPPGWPRWGRACRSPTASRRPRGRRDAPIIHAGQRHLHADILAILLQRSSTGCRRR
jgi:hypothetical protein